MNSTVVVQEIIIMIWEFSLSKGNNGMSQITEIFFSVKSPFNQSNWTKGLRAKADNKTKRLRS